jgi:rod shape-determining protein MreC
MKLSLRKSRIPISLTKPARRLAIFLISLLVLLLLSRFTFMRDLAHGTQYQLVRLGTWAGNGYQNAVANEDTLIGERNALQDQVAALAFDTVHIASLEDTIEQQALLLDYDRFDTSQQTSAHIISRDVDERKLYLDQGSSSGVREGLAVIIGDGHLVAIIDVVHAHTSEARLISAYEQSIAATIYGETRTRGRIEGQDGFYLHMSFVPREERIDVNDVVATSGLDPLIPDQLIIGLVESVESPDQDPFKDILIKPIFDVRDFSEVLILDPLAGL